MTNQLDWPELKPFSTWQDTAETVHMWLQIVGKIRLALAPATNHSWGSALYISTRGITTSPIPYPNGTFTIDFDFIDHTLWITTSEGRKSCFALEPITVAEFYRTIMSTLHALEVHVQIYTTPSEIPDATPFERDNIHASYDPDAMQRLWRAFACTDRVFKEFGARFIGKCSPSHLFWGAMDLAITRFSGRAAPTHPAGFPNIPDEVVIEAYSRELASAGFWPGMGLGEPAFYAYAYPKPAGFEHAPIQPKSAYWHTTLGEFILPYAAVQKSSNPSQTLLSFLQSTYEAAANLAAWDRPALERNPPHPTIQNPLQP